MCATVDTNGTDALAAVCKAGTIRVATDAKYKPASWYNVQTGQWNGFDVQVAQEIAKRLGVNVDIQNQKWDVITAGSWNDRWDLSVGSMTDTIDREKLFDFTPAYYYTPAGVAVNKANTTITSLGDISGKKVCVGVSTTYQDYLKKTLVLGKSAPPVHVPGQQSADRHVHAPTRTRSTPWRSVTASDATRPSRRSPSSRRISTTAARSS